MIVNKIVEQTEDGKLTNIEFHITTEGLEENQKQMVVVGDSEFAFAQLDGATDEDKRKNAYTAMEAKIADNIAKIKEKVEEEKVKKAKVKEEKEGDIKDYK